MGKIMADISMSLDGFVTGPDPDLEHGLGRGGEALHYWAFCEDDPVDAAVLTESTARTGAVVMGRRTFNFVDGPTGWGEEVGYVAGRESFRPPVFVVTHEAPRSVRLTAQFSFVTDGLAAAVRLAQEAADGKNVAVMGGADIVRQAVTQRIADELRIHLAPVLLGSGTRLFDGGELQELEQAGARVSSRAVHLSYRLRPPPGG
jgi:dihydrofolate reductase